MAAKIQSQRSVRASSEFSAAQLDAGAELPAPLALVVFAPLTLTLLEGLAANDDFIAFMLVSSASNSLQIAGSDDAFAKAAGVGCGQHNHEQYCDNPHSIAGI